jgi:hypothetical protein
MQLLQSIGAVLKESSPEALWDLRGDLLALGLGPDAKPFALLAEYRCFLDRISTGTASRDYSERASMMDIAALGGVVASELAEASDPAERARRLLAGVFTEGLAVLATRQHVRAWRGELASVYRETAWYLYEELWRWAARRKPDLDPGERRRLLDRLMAPIADDAVDAAKKTALLVALFQLLLVDALADAVEKTSQPG